MCLHQFSTKTFSRSGLFFIFFEWDYYGKKFSYFVIDLPAFTLLSNVQPQLFYSNYFSVGLFSLLVLFYYIFSTTHHVWAGSPIEKCLLVYSSTISMPPSPPIFLFFVFPPCQPGIIKYAGLHVSNLPKKKCHFLRLLGHIEQLREKSIFSHAIFRLSSYF